MWGRQPYSGRGCTPLRAELQLCSTRVLDASPPTTAHSPFPVCRLFSGSGSSSGELKALKLALTLCYPATHTTPAPWPLPRPCRLFSSTSGELKALKLADSVDDTVWAACMVNSRCFSENVSGEGVWAACMVHSCCLARV